MVWTENTIPFIDSPLETTLFDTKGQVEDILLSYVYSISGNNSHTSIIG